MKLFQPFLLALLLLVPLACDGVVEVLLSKLFFSTVITEGVSSIFEIGKTFVTDAWKVKENVKETTNVTIEKRTEISVTSDSLDSKVG